MTTRIMPALTHRTVSHTPNAVCRSFSNLVAKRINFNSHIQWFSTKNSPRLIVGSPSAEDMRPGEPGYSIFMENALNNDKKWKLFTTSKPDDLEEEIKQFIQIDQEEIESSHPHYVQIPAKSMMSLLREVAELKKRVTSLEGRLTKT